MRRSAYVDVVIFGDGPASLSLAKSLQKQNKLCLIVSRRNSNTSSVGEHLPPESNAVLEQAGLEGALNDSSHLVSHGLVSIWTGNSPDEVDYLTNPYGSGWNLNRKAFDSYIFGEFSRQAIPIMHIATNATVRRVDHGWRLYSPD